MHTICPDFVWWKSVSTQRAPLSYARRIASTVFCGTDLSHMPRCAMLIILSGAVLGGGMSSKRKSTTTGEWSEMWTASSSITTS